jgi:hypothetical protein
MTSQTEGPDEIRPEDLEVSMVRPGVQRGGLTTGDFDPWVRITHKPTGITAVCDSERSQLQNKALALEEIRRQLAARHPVPTRPIATWNAFSPDQLADVIAGVARMDLAPAQRIVARLTADAMVHEFTAQRRDPIGGQLIGGARWLAERDASLFAGWRLHLMESEPEGVA